MKVKYIGFLLLAFCISGCDDFFESMPQDKIAEEQFWKTENDVEKVLTDIYSSSFPKSGQGICFWDESMSDNSYLVWDWWGGQQQLANGTQNSYGQVPTDVWNRCYRNIRKCYNLLENIENISATEDFKQKSIGEAYFLLSYNYYWLVTFFSDVPLVTKVMTIEESKQIEQTSKEQVVNFIVEHLEKAESYLKGGEQEKGKASWGACVALKSRVLLYNEKWQEALEATDELLGKYELNTVGDTPYEDLFSGVAENNSEVIFSVPCDQSTGSIRVGHSGNQAYLLKGMSGGDAFRGMMPTGSLVDSYPMADGRLIHEKGSSYDPKNPYKDRDPRFYQSIIYPTGNIKCLDASSGKIIEVLYDPENPSTIPLQQYNASEPSATGYMWNKYVDWSPYAMTEITDCTNDIIVLRYGEVLLNRAEALLEGTGIGAKNEVCTIIDELRKRCGAGLVHRENYNTLEDLRSLLRNERRIELAGEGTRYFDLLRWKIAEKDNVLYGYGMKGDVYGAYMRLDGVGKNDRTVTVDGVPRRYVETRFFDPSKHYLNPIPQSEIDLNPNLKQNPNW